jgi:hypothetical protein
MRAPAAESIAISMRSTASPIRASPTQWPETGGAGVAQGNGRRRDDSQEGPPHQGSSIGGDDVSAKATPAMVHAPRQASGSSGPFKLPSPMFGAMPCYQPPTLACTLPFPADRPRQSGGQVEEGKW